MFDLIGTLFPMLVVFLLLRGILQTILRGGRRQPEQENDDGSEDYEDAGAGNGQETKARTQSAAKKPDLAAEFERRLQKTSEAQAKAKSAEQELRKEGKAPLAHKQRIHREGEALEHDKGKVYYDPKGDYSYNEARFNAQAAAFRASRTALSQSEARKPRVKLKHSALAQGFIMSQVLDKPRSLKPYGAEEPL